jgi:23S rRNA (adenine2030-N6)-methyltransferase
MNYRHAYHAGNFADVHKHIALVVLLLHLRKKDKPFAVFDSHAGAGLYDLNSDEAARTSEAAGGILKLEAYCGRTPALAQYLEIVRSFEPGRYPGSPLIAARLLRPYDRLVAIERHPEDFARLRRALAEWRNARVLEADGYQRLPSLMPPPERRALILIDPSYEQAGEREQLVKTMIACHRRFATGIFLIWHPLKGASWVEALVDEIRTGIARSAMLSPRIDIGRSAEGEDDRMAAAGLLVVNPPYGFAEEMRAAAEEILPLLQQGACASTTVEWLSKPP